MPRKSIKAIIFPFFGSRRVKKAKSRGTFTESKKLIVNPAAVKGKDVKAKDADNISRLVRSLKKMVTPSKQKELEKIAAQHGSEPVTQSKLKMMLEKAMEKGSKKIILPSANAKKDGINARKEKPISAKGKKKDKDIANAKFDLDNMSPSMQKAVDDLLKDSSKTSNKVQNTDRIKHADKLVDQYKQLKTVESQTKVADEMDELLKQLNLKKSHTSKIKPKDIDSLIKKYEKEKDTKSLAVILNENKKLKYISPYVLDQAIKLYGHHNV